MVLPALIYLNQFNGNWGAYEQALFAIFTADFISGKHPLCCGQRVTYNTTVLDGWPMGFLHVTTQGPIERDRIPDLRKCEHIRWIRPVIEAAGTQHVVGWFSRDETRLLLALPNFSYLVVLGIRRGGYYLLITAHPVENQSHRRKLKAQYNSAKRLTPPC